MKQFLQTLIDGLRVVFLLRPGDTTISNRAGIFFTLIALYFLVMLGIAAVDTPAPWHFVADGVPTLLTDALLTLATAWLLVAFAQRRAIVWGVAAVLLAATIANELVVHWPVEWLASMLDDRGQPALATLLDLLGRTWWFVVLAALAYRLAPQRLPRLLAIACLAYAVSAAAWWWLPSSPLLVHATTPSTGMMQRLLSGGDGTTGSDDVHHAPSVPAFDAEEVMFNQRPLLDAALQRLKPETPGQTDLYVVAFAGDAEEDVFRNEAEYVEKLFSRRFDADGRVLVLVNNAATVATRPLATWTNLHHALDAIANKMDPAEDILLLYLTTHGSEDHELLVDLDPLPLDQIEPEDLADALKTMPGIRWKVIIVNACYSGGFIDALRDDSTLVIASARTDRTSFGCGADSDITWFGKALLADALNQTTSLPNAFGMARKLVGEWESEEQQEASEPQIATSPRLEAKLSEWQQRLPERPPVPFVPAARPDRAH